MARSRSIEITITTIFIGSLFLNLFFGFKYFAGFQYVSKIDKIILTILAVNIYVGLLYFFCRFIKWAITGIVRLSKNCKQS